jgi:hypothetical protein
MRILDNTHERPSRNVALYLTRAEVESFKEKLGWLLDRCDEHFHVEDSTGREVSVSIYGPFGKKCNTVT